MYRINGKMFRAKLWDFRADGSRTRHLLDLWQSPLRRSLNFLIRTWARIN